MSSADRPGGMSRTVVRAYATYARLVWQSSPGWTAIAVTMAVVTGLVPVGTMLTSAWLVANVAGTAAHGLDSAAGHRAITALVLFAAFSVVYAVAEGLRSIATQRLTLKYVASVEDLSAEVSLRPAQIGHLEDPAVAARISALNEANREGMHLDSVGAWLEVITQRLTGWLSALVLVFYHWWVALILVVGWVLLARALNAWVSSMLSELFAVTGSHRRHAEYLRTLMNGREAAKEIRVFGLAPWLSTRYFEHWMQAMRPV